MNNKPLISIITVTYNAGKVIGKTLDSLREQTFQDFEHLIIDGQSRDDTLEVIKVNALPQSQVFSESDNGLYDAMNKGLRKANGKYVLFLNAGDTFHDKDTLGKYAAHASLDKDIIYGDTIIVDDVGKKICDRHLSAPEKLTFDSFSSGMLICHQAFMVKKELTSFFDLKYKLSSDYDWCIECIGRSTPDNCHNLKEVAINYLSDGLTDKNKWNSLKERFTIMSSHYGFFKTLAKHFGFLIRALKRGRI